MPYYLETDDRELLRKLLRTNTCADCSGDLEALYDLDRHLPFLQCKANSEHDGIAKGYQEPRELNIPTRRNELMEQHGENKGTVLAKLPPSGALTQPQAMHILKLVYPDVPEDQIIRTAILCRDFGLHPLMKEVYIIGFKNSKTGMTDYSTVVGIPASRKMAADRKGAFSFLDDSPRAATELEIIKQYGKGSEEEKDNFISICKLRGEKGNEAIGIGLWPKDKEPLGTDKGNTKRNMANIRSERQALDRLPGKALPPDIDVIDVAYVEVPDIGKVDTDTGEIIEGEGRQINNTPKEHWCEEHNIAFDKKKRGTSIWYAHKLDNGDWCNEKKAKNQKEHEPEEGTGQARTEDEPRAEPEKAERDPNTINTLNELFKACNADFNLQPADVIAELGVNSQSDISDTPADCYRRIKAVR